MRKEEILTNAQLRDSIFESRKSMINLDGIRAYIKRNHNYYTLQEVFELNAMILGSYELYHNNKTSLQN